MTIRCTGCGAELPLAALSWPSGSEFCSLRCAERAGLSDGQLKIVRDREQAAAK